MTKLIATTAFMIALQIFMISFLPSFFNSSWATNGRLTVYVMVMLLLGIGISVLLLYMLSLLEDKKPLWLKQKRK